MLLEECKYVVKEKQMPEYITDNIEISSDSDRDFLLILTEKILIKKIPMKKILMKKIRYRIVEYNTDFKLFVG